MQRAAVQCRLRPGAERIQRPLCVTRKRRSKGGLNRRPGEETRNSKEHFVSKADHGTHAGGARSASTPRTQRPLCPGAKRRRTNFSPEDRPGLRSSEGLPAGHSPDKPRDVCLGALHRNTSTCTPPPPLRRAAMWTRERQNPPQHFGAICPTNFRANTTVHPATANPGFASPSVRELGVGGFERPTHHRCVETSGTQRGPAPAGRGWGLGPLARSPSRLLTQKQKRANFSFRQPTHPQNAPPHVGTGAGGGGGGGVDTHPPRIFEIPPNPRRVGHTRSKILQPTRDPWQGLRLMPVASEPTLSQPRNFVCLFGDCSATELGGTTRSRMGKRVPGLRRLGWPVLWWA